MTQVGRIAAVHRGRTQEREWAGRLRRTAIDKQPTTDPVWVGVEGLEGDEVADTEHHGGLLKAVYAVSRTELDFWAGEFDAPMRDGMFGENLTVTGMDVDQALVGERWQVGEAVLEVSWPRIPCRVFAGWLDVQGFDSSGWVKRFTVRARPGTYLSVVTEGRLSVGDAITVVERPEQSVTVSDLFRAATTAPHEVDDLPERLAELVRKQR